MPISILPDSRARESKGRIAIAGTVFIPIYCANCGCDGGGVPEEHCTFAFYLCNSCVEKWGPIAGTYTEPDSVFFERVRLVQLETAGRAMTPEELVRTLEDESAPLTKLAREAPKGR